MKFTRQIKFNLMFYRWECGCVCVRLYTVIMRRIAARRGRSAGGPVPAPRAARVPLRLLYTWELAAGHSVKDTRRLRHGNIL